jgi:hypothetical protein
MQMPDQKQSKCDAQLVIPTADGDNEVVCRCQLEKGHAGHHKANESKYSVTWWPSEVNKLNANDMTVFSYET